MKECPNESNGAAAPGKQGFTLIELLMVISVIGILASLTVGLVGLASRKNFEGAIQAQLNQYVTAIDSYKADFGFVPPDNRVAKGRVNAVTNQLYYELSGTILRDPQNDETFYVKDAQYSITKNVANDYFRATGFANAGQDAARVKGYLTGVKASQYGEIYPGSGVQVLKLPKDWRAGDVGIRPVGGNLVGGKPNLINPWRYDASSTNRHNRNGYDLWAEIIVKGQTNIIGNFAE